MKKIILTISLLAFAFLASAQYVPGKPVLGNQNVYGNQWVKDTARIQYVIADSIAVDTIGVNTVYATTIVNSTGAALVLGNQSTSAAISFSGVQPHVEFYGICGFNNEAIVNDTFYVVGTIRTPSNVYCDTLFPKVVDGKIIYGLNHYDTLSQYISIIGGASDTIVNSDNSSIIGSVGCVVKYNNAAVLIEGMDLPSGILFSRNSTVDSTGVVVGSDGCSIKYESSTNSGYNQIIVGSAATSLNATDYSGSYSSVSSVLDHAYNSTLNGSQNSELNYANSSGIYGSAYSLIYGDVSVKSNECAIIGGNIDTIYQSYHSAIVGSNLCKIDGATNAVIIAAEGITSTKSNTLYTNNLNVSDTIFHDNFYTVNYSDTLAYGDSILLCTGVYSPDCWVAVDTAGIPIGKAEVVIGSNGALAQTYAPYGCIAVGTLTTNKICVLKWGTSVYIKNNRWKHQRISYQITIR